MPDQSTPPQASPEDIEKAVGRLRAMNDQIGLFYAIRAIAENPALLSSKAVEQIRGLYADFDTKHPQQQEPA